MSRRIEIEATAACIVVDRHHIAGLDDVADQLGGGWQSTVDLWKKTEAPFLLLLAHTSERIVKKAPLGFFVMKPENLENAVSTACDLLSDIECTWVQMLNCDARNVVQSALAVDMVTGGTA